MRERSASPNAEVPTPRGIHRGNYIHQGQRQSSRTPSPTRGQAPKGRQTTWRSKEKTANESAPRTRLRTPSPEDCYSWAHYYGNMHQAVDQRQMMDQGQMSGMVVYTPMLVPMVKSSGAPMLPTWNPAYGYAMVMSQEAFSPVTGYGQSEEDLEKKSFDTSESGSVEEASSLGRFCGERLKTRSDSDVKTRCDTDEVLEFAEKAVTEEDGTPDGPKVMSTRATAVAAVAAAAALSGECPSLGSAGHPESCGPACKYHTKSRGCKDGLDCSHCHLCVWRPPKDRSRRVVPVVPPKTQSKKVFDTAFSSFVDCEVSPPPTPAEAHGGRGDKTASKAKRFSKNIVPKMGRRASQGSHSLE